MGEYAICGILGREEGDNLELFLGTEIVFSFDCSLLYVIYTYIDRDYRDPSRDSYVKGYSNRLMNI